MTHRFHDAHRGSDHRRCLANDHNGSHQADKLTISFTVRTEFVLWPFQHLSKSLRMALCDGFVLSGHDGRGTRRRGIGRCGAAF